MLASSSSIGPEYAGCASVKHTFYGERKVLVLEFTSLLRFAKASAGSGASISLTSCIDLVRDADGEQLKLMAATVTMKTAVVGEGMSLYCPWGWLVAELAVNGVDAVGFKWSLTPDHAGESFASLSKMMLPSANSIKVNSVATLLQKVCDALNKLDNGNVLKLDPTSAKSEKGDGPGANAAPANGKRMKTESIGDSEPAAKSLNTGGA